MGPRHGYRAGGVRLKSGQYMSPPAHWARDWGLPHHVETWGALWLFVLARITHAATAWAHRSQEPWAPTDIFEDIRSPSQNPAVSWTMSDNYSIRQPKQSLWPTI